MTQQQVPIFKTIKSDGPDVPFIDLDFAETSVYWGPAATTPATAEGTVMEIPVRSDLVDRRVYFTTSLGSYLYTMEFLTLTNLIIFKYRGGFGYALNGAADVPTAWDLDKKIMSSLFAQSTANEVRYNNSSFDNTPVDKQRDFGGELIQLTLSPDGWSSLANGTYIFYASPVPVRVRCEKIRVTFNKVKRPQSGSIVPLAVNQGGGDGGFAYAYLACLSQSGG